MQQLCDASVSILCLFDTLLDEELILSVMFCIQGCHQALCWFNLASESPHSVYISLSSQLAPETWLWWIYLLLLYVCFSSTKELSLLSAVYESFAVVWPCAVCFYCDYLPPVPNYHPQWFEKVLFSIFTQAIFSVKDSALPSGAKYHPLWILSSLLCCSWIIRHFMAVHSCFLSSWRVLASFIVGLFNLYEDLYFTYLEINPLGMFFHFVYMIILFWKQEPALHLGLLSWEDGNCFITVTTPWCMVS